MVSVVSLLSFRCSGGFVSVFRWFRSGVSMVSAVPVVSVVSFRWLRFGVSGFSTCPRELLVQIYRFSFAGLLQNILTESLVMYHIQLYRRRNK